MNPPPRLAGLAYGPGFAGTGSKVEFELSAFGLRLVAEEAQDGTVPWGEVGARRGGFNDAQVMLEWEGRAGRYALAVADPAAVAAIRDRLAESAPDKAKLKGAGGMGAGRGTRRWSHLMLWATVLPILLPVLLIAVLLIEHERVAAWAVSHIPLEQEKKLGALVFEQTRARLKPVEGEALKLVREVGAKLTRGSAYTYEFHVVEDATVNAFAVPGGFIVVHTGLLALATSAEEVSGVLAHEVQHVEKRHSLKAMAKTLGLTALASLVFGDLGGLAGMGQQLIGLNFSRQHESEADAEGLKALVAAGIAPAGMRDFFRKMGEKEKLNLGWLSSHPASEDRFAAIDAAIKALPPSAAAVPLPYDYAAIKAALPKAVPAPKDKP